MIVNGVTLPDIPDEAKNKYSHFFIVAHTRTGNVEIDSYNLYCANDAMAYIPGSLMGMDYSYLVNSTPGYTAYTCSKLGDFKWSSGSFCSETDPANCIIGTVDMGTWEDATTLIWADHDIKTVTGFDQSTGEFFFGDIYFPNSEAPKLTRVSIGRSLVDGYAREVQRLTGTTEQMNAIQIREKLSTVKAGIKIGDVVLPPIPDGVLEQYPYAVIVHASYGGDQYALLACDSTFYYVSKELSGNPYGDGSVVGQSGVGVVYVWQNSSTEWTLTDDEVFTPVGELVTQGTSYGVYTLVWANHDVCIATTFTTPTEVTIGTEVYFSERQSFNGVWLPKMPADVLTECPYASVHCMKDATDISYELIIQSSVFDSVPSDVWNPIMGEILTLPDGVSIMISEADVMHSYGCLPNSPTWRFSRTDNDIMIADGNVLDIEYSTVWSNHDIREVTGVDANTGEYFYSDKLFFPPLPAIDTNRISIGYDLCNGIVEEVQRLSGEQDKMDALQAYWKLTTVVGMVGTPGTEVYFHSSV